MPPNNAATTDNVLTINRIFRADNGTWQVEYTFNGAAAANNYDDNAVDFAVERFNNFDTLMAIALAVWVAKDPDKVSPQTAIEGKTVEVTLTGAVPVRVN